MDDTQDEMSLSIQMIALQIGGKEWTLAFWAGIVAVSSRVDQNRRIGCKDELAKSSYP